MLTFRSKKGVEFCDGMHRRDFLRVGSVAAGSVGLSMAEMAGASSPSVNSETRCILLFLVGGPSQLETFDPKPAAPSNVRGPFQAIETRVPGMRISEHLPRTAQLAGDYAILRSVHHRAAPVHETGHQLMQSGFLSTTDHEYPHYGSVVSKVRGAGRGGLPPFVVLPAPIGNTGVNISHGQGAGYLGEEHEPLVIKGNPASRTFRPADAALDPELDPARLTNRRALVSAIDDAERSFDGSRADARASSAYNVLFSQNVRRAFDVAAESEASRSRYGQNTFGQSCLLARRLVEQGVRLVTVNMFDSVFNRVTWDCHADSGSLPSTLRDYQQTLCPMFDLAYSALLEDLKQRGMLDNTLVLAMGEFGRTPYLNSRGGRDHWPGVYSVLFAGGGVRGGQVIGSSDRIGAEPHQRPITPAEIAASVYHSLGIDRNLELIGANEQKHRLVDAQPITELFG